MDSYLSLSLIRCVILSKFLNFTLKLLPLDDSGIYLQIVKLKEIVHAKCSTVPGI